MTSVSSTTAHSFELFPPRSERAAAALPGAVEALAATGPEFFSVTYGAAGSTTEASLDLVQRVVASTGIDVMAHLTCAGIPPAEVEVLVRRFLDLGAQRFLALRGDDFAGGSPDALRTAADLVRLIRRVHAEQAAAPIPRIAVAAFVNGYPGARTTNDHLDALLAKQEAGADLAITQVFFEADHYAAFLARARDRGVVLPIVPGVLPVTGTGRLRKILELSGEDEPTGLAAALEAEPTERGRYEVGVDHATRLGDALLAAGAPALHLYTFNRADAAVDVLDRLGLASAPIKETT